MTLARKREVRRPVVGQLVCGGRGRTDHPRYVGWNVPVEEVEGAAAPEVKGLPYWKTNFTAANGFSKTLYTPSTLRVEVGRDWRPE